MSRIAVLVTVAVAAIAGGACDRHNPAAPTAGANVTITGTITAPVPAGLSVTAGGSSGTALVDGAGQFTLTDAPSGSVLLRFNGGATASLMLTNVLANQTVTIVAAVSGTSATLESVRRVLGTSEEIEGAVETVTAPAMLVVAGRTVSIASGATLTANGQIVQFDVLAPGQRVLVRGQATGPALVAQSLEILTAVVVGNVSAGGVISGLAGVRTAFQFTAGNTLIQADGSTAFDATSAFNELGNGLMVQVTGAQQQGYVYATKIQITSPKATAFGRIIAMSGTAPQLVLTLPSHTLLVSEFTDVRRKGSPQRADTIAVGQTIDVTARAMPDGTLVAGGLNILTDSPGGRFLMTGTVSAISGTCVNLRITVLGYTIATDGSTAFTGVTCAGLAAGDTVEVDGVVQADYSVAANSVKKL